MSADNNYNEILEKVCKKLNEIDSVKDLDLLGIKNSIESIENVITDTQAKLNFEEIKEKLQNISIQVDNCNESLLKDLYNDLNKIKEKSEDFTAHLENIQNVQNLALTSAEFEEFQKQQLDLALKSNENIAANNAETLQHLESQLNNLHKNLSSYLEQMAEKFENPSNSNEFDALITDISTINQKNIEQTNSLIKELETNFSEFKNNEFAVQLSKISDIYDSLGIIHAWIEKVGFLNKSIEDVYARLGANIDFDDVSEKVDIIYENIAALNNWTMKIDNIDGNMAEMQSKVASLSSCIEDTRNIAEVINNIKDKFDSSFTEDVDLEDLSNKMDIVYENLTSLNEWAQKIDIISDDIRVINNELTYGKINLKLDKVTEDISKIDGEKINNIADKISKIDGEKIDIIADEVSRIDGNKINDIAESVSKVGTKVDLSRIDNSKISTKIDKLSENIAEMNAKVEETRTDSAEVSSRIDDLTKTVSSINDVFEEELITSKIDVIYDNIELLNQWVSKIDNVAQKSDELDEKLNKTSSSFNIKAEEITQTLANALKIIEDVPNIKDKLEDVSKELHLITRTTKNETESYVYTLLDIETDFLKLHKFLDDKTEKTTQDINSLKERFEELNDDIASISKRTNKLILSADDANKEFKSHLEMFKNAIAQLDVQRQELNPELKFNTIGKKLADISLLMQNSLNANNNLNTAFVYLAEWVDATGNILNSMQTEIGEIKAQTEKDETLPELASNFAGLKEEVSSFTSKIQELEENFSNYKNDDVSEIKSLLTGIIVQLNTALTPDIDTLNEKIEKLSEDNNNKLTELETLMKEKIDYQAKQINALEARVESLNGKFDKLIETIGDNKNDEIKDILNYITTQINSTNEKLNSISIKDVTLKLEDLGSEITETSKSQTEANEIINKVAEKLESFDDNINKIVSYIEED